MKLNNICLEEFIRPCLVYALRRATDGMGMREFEKLPKLEIPEDTDKIPVGAILYWENAEGEKGWQLTVEEKTVLETYTFNRGHYGVYEGDGIFSDLGWTGEDIPHIRFRKYKDTSPADKMIIIK